MKFPLWNQLADPLPDGAMSPTAASDCGWECVAMIVAAYRGLDFDAAALRQAALIPATEWGSRAGELSRTLNGFRLRSMVKRLDSPMVFAQSKNRAQRGLPSIILGRWLIPTELHWVLVVGSGPNIITVNDPWGGHRRNLNAGDVYARAEGTVVQVNESYPQK